MPLTVGIRARTMHSTSGSDRRSFGFLVPHPPPGTVLSTGTERGSSDGVEDPGVDGGVNSGERRMGGGKVDGSSPDEDESGAQDSEACVGPERSCSRGTTSVSLACNGVDFGE